MIEPYYDHGGTCGCGCGAQVSKGRRFVMGHNRRGSTNSPTHNANIALALEKAWKTKRKRMPVGTECKDSYGYIRVKVEVGNGRWKLQHAVVMERHIGRQLVRGEIVHHINGDRADNRLENLALCESIAHHMNVEATLRAAFRDGFARGLFVFDHNAMEYRLA